MQKFVKIACLLAFCLCFAAPASAQWSLFVVEPGGSDTSYATLEGALLTAASFPNGPHKVMIKAGSYSDVNLTASNIDEIYGDPAAAPGDILFTAATASDNFLAMTSGLTVQNMKVVGYATAFSGAVSDAALLNIVIEGASGTGVNVSGWTNGMIDGLTFSTLDYGVHGTSSTAGLTVQNCTFDNVNFALDITDCDNGLFDLLEIANGNYGLVLRSGSHPNALTNSTITGLNNDGVWLYDANVDMSGNLVHNNAGYAVNKNLGTGSYWLMTVQDNCFFDNAAGTAECYSAIAGITVAHNYYGDGNYTWDGGVTTDGNPWQNENNPMGPSSVEVYDPVDVQVQWTIPACGGLDSVQLAAYEFTVHYPTGLLAYVSGSAAYDQAYLGAVEDGALYTNITVDEIAGTITFAATNFTAPGIGTAILSSMQFEAIGTGTATISIASQYLDENTNPIPTGTTNLDINVVDTQAPSIDVTASNPVGDHVYSEGGPGAGPHVLLHVEGNVTDNYALKNVRYRFDGAGVWQQIKNVSGKVDTYGALPGDFYVDINALTEGAHTLNLRVRDQSNNDGFVDYAFTIDRTGPVLTTVTLRDADGCAVDPEFTNDPAIKVDLVDDGTGVNMEFYDSEVPGWQGAIPYASPADYTLLDPDEDVTRVYVRLYDVYGNMGNQVWDEIELDMTAPVPSNFVIAGGDAKTSILTPNADVNHGGIDAVEYAVSMDENDLTCGSGAWVSGRPHPFPVQLNTPDGIKKVWYASRDKAGNISAHLWDEIELDQTAPIVTSVLVTGGAGDGIGKEDCTDTWQVNVEVTFSDTDVVYIRFSNDGGGWTSYGDGVTPMTSPFTGAFTMSGSPASDQTITIDVELEDNSKPAPGNIGTGSDDIYLDYSVPSLTGVTLVDAAATAMPAHAEWTNSLTVNIELSGLSDDVTALVISEDNFATSDTVDVSGSSPFADPFVYQYTYQGTPASCNTSTNIWVDVMDCSGNMPGGMSDGIVFDLTPPTFDDFSGPVQTNNLTVTLALTAADDCPTSPSPWRMRISEDDPSFSSASWIPFSATPTFVLEDKSPSSNDGSRTLYAEVADPAGNIDASVMEWTIEVDMSPPTGSMVVQQDPVANPYAMPGYTDNLSEVEAVSISYSGDAVLMQIQALGGGGTSVIVPVAGTYSPITLSPNPGEGAHTVRIRFQDGALNWGPWDNQTIIYDVTAPAPPPLASGGPGGSVELSWDPSPGAASYILRENFTNEYPEFTNGLPPHPMTLLEGIPVGETSETTFTFDAPQSDIYAISVWARDSAGNISATCNTDVISTNYIRGDFWDSDLDALGHDNCLDFVDEFGNLALAYNTNQGDPGFDPYLDIAPGMDGASQSYPMPDDAIDFEDLVRFAINYDAHRCGAGAVMVELDNPKPAAFAPVAIAVDVPGWVTAGEEYELAVRVSNAAAIKGYHIILGNTGADFDLLSVAPGDSYPEAGRSFFYYDPDVSYIDVSGVVLGAETAFGDGELFRIRVKARSTGQFQLEDPELVIRDSENRDVDVEFSVDVVASIAPIPTEFGLTQNYPNPFNAGTVMPLSLKEASDWTLTIYNIAGQVVRRFSGSGEAGVINVAWDGTSANGTPVASGMYFYRAIAGDFTATKKMVLLK